MSAEQTTTLVQRKARTAREAQAARTMSLSRALRLTAAKQAERLMALPLSALSITRRTINSEDIPGCLDAASLTLLMDGPGVQVAAVILDPVLVKGLIQQQTMGKVTPAPEGGETRAHTATDAALCAPFFESLLSCAAILPDAPEDCAIVQGYRFGVWAKEPRQARLALDASDYTLIEMTLDLAAGTRAGKLLLVLPVPVRVSPEPHEEADAPKSMVATQNLTNNVMGLTAELTIALTRFKLPLQRVNEFKSGDLIDLNISNMTQALVIDGNGRAITRGTLGQIDGLRAVQVEQQSKQQHTQPRRRATDRDELDLPDVTSSGTQTEFDPPAASDLPSFTDMDVFGNVDDLPELPDINEAAEAADAKMSEWKTAKVGDGAPDRREEERQTQAGW